MEPKPQRNRAPALTLIAVAAAGAAFLYPAYSWLWLVAAVFSLAAAYYAAQLQPRGGRRSGLVSSVLFTLLGLAIGLILINML